MESATFRRWLSERGCSFDAGKDTVRTQGHAYVTVRLGDRSAVLPDIETASGSNYKSSAKSSTNWVWIGTNCRVLRPAFDQTIQELKRNAVMLTSIMLTRLGSRIPRMLGTRSTGS